MKLITKQLFFQDLYSASKKLVISGQDSVFFQDNFKLPDEISVYEFTYDLPSQQGKITVLGEDDSVDLVEMQLAPNFFLGLFVFSESAKQELKDLRVWWAERSPQGAVPSVMEFDAGQDLALVTRDFWQQMYGQMAAQNSAIAKRLGSLQQQYLELRTLHENVQNAFAAVEDYLSLAKLPDLQLVFDNQPMEEDDVEFYQLKESPSIRQLLPVSSRGLAVLELHLASKDDRATGYLQVQLKACEDKNSFVQWQIPYQQLSKGWLGLDLPQIELGRKRDVELIIEWHTDLGPAPTLSLGSRQPIPEVQVFDNGVQLENSLAFRIWTGLPGTRRVTSPYLISLNNDCKSLALGYLGQGAIARVREVTPNVLGEDNPYIQVIDHGAKILTRPRPDGSPTIAMLPFCFPPTANSVTATVMTEHTEADVMEYALVIMSKEMKPENGLREDLVLASSGWVSVEANTPRQISVSLAGSVDEHCHLVIATRLAASSIAAFAQTCWLNFKLADDLNSFDRSVSEMSEPAIAYVN